MREAGARTDKGDQSLVTSAATFHRRASIFLKIRHSSKSGLVNARAPAMLPGLCMKADIHPKYQDAEIRCACGNVIKTRSTKPVILVGICNVCHPFYTGQQKFVDTAGRVDKFQQRMAETHAAQAAAAESKKKKK